MWRLLRRVRDALQRNLFDTVSWSVAITGIVAAAAVTNSLGVTVVVAIAVAIVRWALSVWRNEAVRRPRVARRGVALRHLRECAGALMKGTAAFAGKPDPPQEWGPRPPMNLDDLARCMREGEALWYATRETATVSGWAAGVRSSASTFGSCAQALVPDLSDDDRDLLNRAQRTANETTEVLEHLAGRWRAMDSLREFSRQNRPEAEFMTQAREPLEKQIGADCEKLAPLLQQLSDLLVAIAKRAG